MPEFAGIPSDCVSELGSLSPGQLNQVFGAGTKACRPRPAGSGSASQDDLEPAVAEGDVLVGLGGRTRRPGHLR